MAAACLDVDAATDADGAADAVIAEFVAKGIDTATRGGRTAVIVGGVEGNKIDVTQHALEKLA